MNAFPPPLHTLRVFEAAARHLNFTRAGEELGMTQAAVSYHIRLLEERVGGSLFRREGRKLVPTDCGAELGRALGSAFRSISTAFETARTGLGGSLSISALPTLSVQWLSRRLGDFQLAHPHLAVSLETSTSPADFANGGVDIGVWGGTGFHSDLVSHELFEAEFTPMLSPDLAATIGGVTSAADLLKLPFVNESCDWIASWMKDAGIERVHPPGAPGVNLGSQCFEAAAAVAGKGVAMLTPAFYRQEAREGKLVRPFAATGKDGQSYWLVYPHASRNLPKVRMFRDWILAEAESLRSAA